MDLWKMVFSTTCAAALPLKKGGLELREALTPQNRTEQTGDPAMASQRSLVPPWKSHLGMDQILGTPNPC